MSTAIMNSYKDFRRELESIETRLTHEIGGLDLEDVSTDAEDATVNRLMRSVPGTISLLSDAPRLSKQIHAAWRDASSTTTYVRYEFDVQGDPWMLGYRAPNTSLLSTSDAVYLDSEPAPGRGTVVPKSIWFELSAELPAEDHRKRAAATADLIRSTISWLSATLDTWRDELEPRLREAVRRRHAVLRSRDDLLNELGLE